MIEVYKIINNIHDSKVSDKLLAFRKNVAFNLRGNDYTLEQKRIYKPECKNIFSNKIVTTWNTLLNIVVKSESLNVFKNRLDKLWENQELLTDYRSVLDKKRYTNIKQTTGTPPPPHPTPHLILSRRYDQPIKDLYLRTVITLNK